jgi:putrescine aminotransferase
MSAPGSENRLDEVPELYRRHLGSALGRLGRLLGGHVELASAGSRVRVSDGHEYLDCSGYGVFLLGHCHPRVVEAVVEQVRSHPLPTRVLLEANIAEAAAALAAVSPEGLDFVYLVTSGAEATEMGIKLARSQGKRRVVSTEGGYHGKTMGALSVTGKERYRAPFEPLLPDVAFVPFGDIRSLEAELTGAGDECVLLEPVQGEGGVRVPPPGYLAEVRELCDAKGAFLMLDEIQTGLGRLGAWWGADREGVVPDILLAGKVLTGGVVPLAAVIAPEAVYREFSLDPLLHTGTFHGIPLAAAAAKATLDVLREDRLVERAAELGSLLLPEISERLENAAGDLVTEVRGVGLLIGIEFIDDTTAAEFILELVERRVLVNTSLNTQNVVRLTPPAIITDEEIEWLLTAVSEGGQALAAARGRTPVKAAPR